MTSTWPTPFLGLGIALTFTAAFIAFLAGGQPELAPWLWSAWGIAALVTTGLASRKHSAAKRR